VHAVVRCPGLAPNVQPNRLKFAVVTSSSSPQILAVPAGSVTEETVTKQQATVPRPVSTTAGRSARAQQRSHENLLLAERQIRSKPFACKSAGRPGKWSHGMTRYLISFGAHAMDHIPDEEMPAVAKASHEVVQAAISAGVRVFGGGLENQ
jgi:hypothetical protein